MLAQLLTVGTMPRGESSHANMVSGALTVRWCFTFCLMLALAESNAFCGTSSMTWRRVRVKNGGKGWHRWNASQFSDTQHDTVPTMNLRWIEDFIALCDTRSFSVAAQRRYITQSALSKHIKALESWLGSEALIDRSSNPIVLTPVGAAFRERAIQIIALLKSAQREAESSSRAVRNIYIAAPHVLSVTFFPSVSRLLGASGKDICLRIIANNFRESLACYESCECDLLLCYNNAIHNLPFDSSEQDKITLGNDYLVPVSVADDQGQPKYRLGDDCRECLPYLAYADETYLGAVLKRQPSFLQRSLQLSSRGESTFAESLRAGVRGGLGLAWLPLGLVEKDLKSGAIAIAGGMDDCIPLDIEVYRKRQMGRREVQDTWDLLKVHGGNYRKLELPDVKEVDLSEDGV